MITHIENNGSLHKAMTSWRQEIHANPETALEEFNTAKKIVEILRTLPNIEIHEGLAKTGVVGVLTGNKGDNGSMIGLRADIDALNVTEETDLPYESQTVGKMHACGHDGHTTMLLGAAQHLSENPNFAGKVVFIFQPAEESFGGGRIMVEEGLFEQFPCDSVYGLHNVPGSPVGQFTVHEKEVMASADTFTINITGKGAHAAMPHLGFDPIVIGSEIVTAIQTLVSRNISPTESAVVSVTKFDSGSACNIIPERATLWGTLRTFNEDIRQHLIKRISDVSSGIAKAHNAHAEAVFDFNDAYPATINNPENAKLCADVAISIVGSDNVLLNERPSMGGEDFAFMLREKPGAYVWLGNGDGYGLHHPKYNFNDECLSIGANYWVELTYQLLNK